MFIVRGGGGCDTIYNSYPINEVSESLHIHKPGGTTAPLPPCFLRPCSEFHKDPGVLCPSSRDKCAPYSPLGLTSLDGYLNVLYQDIPTACTYAFPGDTSYVRSQP